MGFGKYPYLSFRACTCLCWRMSMSLHFFLQYLYLKTLYKSFLLPFNDLHLHWLSRQKVKHIHIAGFFANQSHSRQE